LEAIHQQEQQRSDLQDQINILRQEIAKKTESSDDSDVECQPQLSSPDDSDVECQPQDLLLSPDDSDVEPQRTSKKYAKKVLSPDDSDESSCKGEKKPKHSPSKKCPQCGAKIPCACTKCPQCGKSALRQDKRSKAERERRERKRRKINGHVATKLKFTEEVSA